MLSLLPIILIIYFFISLKNRESISFELKRGLKCQSCKEDIDGQAIDWSSIPLTSLVGLQSLDHNIKTCISCKRDESIDSVIGGKKHIISKLRIYMISDKFKTVQKVLLALLVLVLIVNIICIFNRNSTGGIIINLFNTLYWIVIIIQNRITSIKKIKNITE